MAKTFFQKNTIHIVGPSLKPWIGYLEKLESEPSPQTIATLNSILDAAFYTAALNTHVQTGRLRTSLNARDQHILSARRNRWVGEIGIGRGVPYAKYETGDRRRGVRPDWTSHPSHDPFDGLEIYYAGIDAVLRAIG